jgi:hypothetical protein
LRRFINFYMHLAPTCLSWIYLLVSSNTSRYLFNVVISQSVCFHFLCGRLCLDAVWKQGQLVIYHIATETARPVLVSCQGGTKEWRTLIGCPVSNYVGWGTEGVVNLKFSQEWEGGRLLCLSRRYLLQVACDIELISFFRYVHMHLLFHNLCIQLYLVSVNACYHWV